MAMAPHPFERDAFLFRQAAGGIENPIDVFDDAGNRVAYIHFPVQAERSCLTVLVCVPTFFAFPVAAIWVLSAVCSWMGVVNPMNIDRQPIIIPIVVLMLIVVLGLVVMACIGSLLAPKRRASVYTDSSQREVLLHVAEDRKSKYNTSTLTVTDADLAVLGRIRANRRNEQVDILCPDGHTLASFCASENATPVKWTPEAVLTLLVGVLIGLATLLFVIIVPKKERRYSKAFLWRPNQQADSRYQEIGTIVFDPSKEFPYAIRLTSDPDVRLDRRLVIALATVLDW